MNTVRSKTGLWIRIHFPRIWIRMQSLMLETNTDPDPIRIQGFNDKKLKKNYSWKFFYIFFWSKTAIYLSLGLHKVCPSYRRGLQFSKEAIQHFKTKSRPTSTRYINRPGSINSHSNRMDLYFLIERKKQIIEFESDRRSYVYKISKVDTQFSLTTPNPQYLKKLFKRTVQRDGFKYFVNNDSSLEFLSKYFNSFSWYIPFNLSNTENPTYLRGTDTTGIVWHPWSLNKYRMEDADTVHIFPFQEKHVLTHSEKLIIW